MTILSSASVFHWYLKRKVYLIVIDLIFCSVTCSSLSLGNGAVTYNLAAVAGGYPVYTVASFTCNSGYSRSGASSSTCQTSGQWSMNKPICNQSKSQLHIFDYNFPLKNEINSNIKLTHHLPHMTFVCY